MLSRLAERANFIFSYNPAILEADELLTASFTDKTVREVLNALFNGKLQYREKKNYVILSRAPEPSPESSVSPLIITGYILDQGSGHKLPSASIYDPRTLSASVSDQYGFFELRIERPSATNRITISKQHYNDTIVTFAGAGKKFFTVALQPEDVLLADTVSRAVVVSDTLIRGLKTDPEAWKKKLEPVSSRPVSKPQRKPGRINILNIRDTLYRDAQISFVPFAGTNHILSGNVINDYSFNILGGFSGGTRKLELGGIANLDRGDVQYWQLAGVFNTIGGRMTGFQFGGVFNLNVDGVDGIQFGGVFNANGGVSTGWQYAGVFNFNLHGMRGFQGAGVVNANWGDSRGWQLAGVANLQGKDFKGVQLAGVLNTAINEVHGAQIAGVMNFGRKVKGLQLGLLNIADTIQGVPIGLISLVRKGYHAVELSADDIFYANMAFRTGVRPFYNILMAGIRPDNFGDPLWCLGYGIGTTPRVAPWLYMNVDLISTHISKGHLFTEATNLLNKAYAGVEIKIYKSLSFTGGVTFNGYLTNRFYSDYPDLFENHTPHFVSEEPIGNEHQLQTWWGWKAGVRFL